MGAPEPSGARGVGPRASFGQRFLAYLLDIIILMVVNGIFFVILPRALQQVIGIVIGLAYFTYFEGSGSGQSIGKRALKIRVVDFNTGQRLDLQRALIRNLGRILSGLICFLGYFWMLWDKDKQTWHDKIGTTTVVPVANFPVDQWPG